MWLGHLCRMQQLDPCIKPTVLKEESTGRVGKPKVRWVESGGEDLKKGVRNWRRKKQDRERWRTVVEEAMIHKGLQCQKK